MCVCVCVCVCARGRARNPCRERLIEINDCRSSGSMRHKQNVVMVGPDQSCLCALLSAFSTTSFLSVCLSVLSPFLPPSLPPVPCLVLQYSSLVHRDPRHSPFSFVSTCHVCLWMPAEKKESLWRLSLSVRLHAPASKRASMENRC